MSTNRNSIYKVNHLIDKDNIKMTLEICESNICSSGNDYFEVKHRLMGLFDQFYDDNISTIGGNVENGKIEVRLKNKY